MKNKLKNLMDEKSYDEAVEIAKHNPDRPLCKWYVDILNKSWDELSNFDLIRCIRQEIFLKNTVVEIIERILGHGTPFYAAFDSIELMEKLSSVDRYILLEHKEQLIDIINNILKNDLINKSDIWMYDDEKKEYMSYIQKIEEKIS